MVVDSDDSVGTFVTLFHVDRRVTRLHVQRSTSTLFPEKAGVNISTIHDTTSDQTDACSSYNDTSIPLLDSPEGSLQVKLCHPPTESSCPNRPRYIKITELKTHKPDNSNSDKGFGLVVLVVDLT